MLILRAAACGGRKAASSDDKTPIRQQLIKGFCHLRLNDLFRERKILHLGCGFSFQVRGINLYPNQLSQKNLCLGHILHLSFL